MLARIVSTQNHIINAANVHESHASSVGNRGLYVFLHFSERVGQTALDRLQNPLALDVLVFAFIKVAG